MSRLTNAWRALTREQRLAALCSLGLFVSMLLPWYSKTVVESAKPGLSKLPTSQASLSAFQAFSFVEAAVLLVSAGVLAMLFARAEQRDFHLPGGDGTIVMIAGGWAAVLIFYRLLDKPGLQRNERIAATVGVEWGIFIALLLALALVYTGGRIRAAERLRATSTRTRRREREPRDPDDDVTVSRPPDEPRRAPVRADRSEDVTSVAAASGRPRTPTLPPAREGATPAAREEKPGRRRPRFPPAPSDQMSFEDPPPPARGE
jgi:hypothetical protein